MGGGFFSRMPILRNTPTITVSRPASGSVASFTQTITIPTGLPASAQLNVLAIWLQEVAGDYTMKLDGAGPDGAVAASNATGLATPCAGAFRWVNPAAGPRSLVLTQTNLRSLVTCFWIFDQMHPTTRLEATYQLEASANATTVPVSLATTVPTYGIGLVGAQGGDMAPASIDSGWSNIGTAHTNGGLSPSLTTDVGYIAVQKPLPEAGTYTPTVTFAGSDGRGAIVLAIRGA